MSIMPFKRGACLADEGGRCVRGVTGCLVRGVPPLGAMVGGATVEGSPSGLSGVVFVP
jgi:hypothetical protein